MTTTPRDSSRTGTQSIERCMELLKLIASRRQHGWRLTDLAVQSGLGLSTTHRIAHYLLRERLVQLRDEDRHYIPGPGLFELGIALPASYGRFVEACGPMLSRIARRTGGVAYLMVRSDAESVCLARQGTLHTRALTIEAGSRRPLLLSAGGLAILIALDRAERARALKANRDEVRRRHRPPAPIERALRESLRLRFGLYRGAFLSGIEAVGVATLDSNGRVFGSVSAAVAGSDSPLSRLKQIAALLRSEADAVSREAQRHDVHW
jgi:DNA-binding IclR family transcriptional regulator